MPLLNTKSLCPFVGWVHTNEIRNVMCNDNSEELPARLLNCKLKFFPQIIKDFYLLGRGELFQAFIDTAQHMLKTPPTAVTEHGNCPVGLRITS